MRAGDYYSHPKKSASYGYADLVCVHVQDAPPHVVWLSRYDYWPALSQSHPGRFTLRCSLNLQRCIKVRHQMHHALAAPKNIIDSTHILLPIRPVCITPTNYNPVAMGAIGLIGLISVRKLAVCKFWSYSQQISPLSNIQ